jgi:hypothetical protein
MTHTCRLCEDAVPTEEAFEQGVCGGAQMLRHDELLFLNVCMHVCVWLYVMCVYVYVQRHVYILRQDQPLFLHVCMCVHVMCAYVWVWCGSSDTAAPTSILFSSQECSFMTNGEMLRMIR